MGRIVGIDYSLSCPSLCIQEKNNKSFPDSKIHFLTDNKKMTGVFGNITGHSHKDFICPEQRYEQIAFWVLSQLDVDVEKVFIEDYSFGSKGRTFHIAENAGLLKYHFYKLGISFHTIPPTTIKKHYSGKGNADKNKMEEYFRNETGIDLYKTLGKDRRKNVISPISDIIDSYAIAKYGQDNQ